MEVWYVGELPEEEQEPEGYGFGDHRVMYYDPAGMRTCGYIIDGLAFDERFLAVTHLMKNFGWTWDDAITYIEGLPMA